MSVKLAPTGILMEVCGRRLGPRAGAAFLRCSVSRIAAFRLASAASIARLDLTIAARRELPDVETTDLATQRNRDEKGALADP